MIDPNKVCLGCMRETAGEEICPYCGFSLKNYEAERNIRILPAGTILNGKYLVGKGNWRRGIRDYLSCAGSESSGSRGCKRILSGRTGIQRYC